MVVAEAGALTWAREDPGDDVGGRAGAHEDGALLLTTAAVRTMALTANELSAPAHAHLADALTGPVTAFERAFGTDVFSHVDANPELTAPFEADDLDIAHIRFPNTADKSLAGCEAGTVICVFTPGEVTVYPYLVFAARTPASQHSDSEFIVGNIVTDDDIAERLDAYRFHDRYQVGPSVLFDPDDRVLLIHARDPDDPDHHWWELPGGDSTPGESPTDAARREVAEETGLLIDGIGAKLWTRESRFHYRGRDHHRLDHVYLARTATTTPQAATKPRAN